MALAQRLADEAEQSGLGRRVGTVVVDPAIETIDGDGADWDQAIVAVAGDARYSRLEKETTGPGPNPASQTYNADLEGGPELHALMRAVDIVARRRREDNTSASTLDKDYLSPLESHFFYQSDAPPVSEAPDPSPVPEKLQKTDGSTAHCTKTAEPAVSTSRIRPRALGGYLCTDLDVYLSREPCLCCSMGVLLSRFRAVIFPRTGRMVTGGIASEPVVSPVCDDNEDEEEITELIENTGDKSRDPRNNRKYYGLHWRKELNWRALGFEFVEDGCSFETGIEGEDGVAFHA